MKNILVVLLALPFFVFSQTEKNHSILKKNLKNLLNFQHFMVELMEVHHYQMIILIL